MQHVATRTKTVLITLLKFAISGAILAALVILARREDPQTFSRMLYGPKRWDMLAGALLFCFLAVVLTIVRWFYLVRALAIHITPRDGLRLGFLGYFCNFISLGSVGGDLFKAIFLAREQPTKRPEAVASVVVDRLLGLYGLFVVSSAAILLAGLQHSDLVEMRVIAKTSFVATVVGAAALGMLLLPGFTTGPLSELLTRLPRLGRLFARLIGAVRMYRRQAHVLLLAVGMSCGVHVLFATGIYLIARGLPGNAPGAAGHYAVVPLAMLCGAMPLPLSGLGAFEAAIEFMYTQLPLADGAVPAGQGLLVSLTYRMLTIVIAMIGAAYYILARRDIAATIREAHLQQNAEAALAAK